MKSATTIKESSKPSSKSERAKRIVIVDDHPLFRKGLEQLINSSDDAFNICGEAGDAAEGMSAIRQLKPDLAIVDLGLPGANGIELIKNIRAEFQKLPVLILSMHDESLYALRALRAGAQGYVVKEQAANELLEAIRTALAGEVYLARGMASVLLHKLVGPGLRSSPSGIECLTDRELHVLEFWAPD